MELVAGSLWCSPQQEFRTKLEGGIGGKVHSLEMKSRKLKTKYILHLDSCRVGI